MGAYLLQFKQTLDQLGGLKDPRTVFTYMTVIDTPCFGYRGPLAPRGAMFDYPINNHFVVGSGGVQRAVKTLPPNTPKKKIVPAMFDDEADNAELGPDLTRPTDEDRRLAAGMYAIRLPSTLSLGEYCKAVLRNAQGGAANAAPITLTVDPGLAQKPLSVFGLEGARANVLIRGAAALYRLWLLVPRANEYHFALYQSGGLHDDGDFSAEVHRILPDPLARAYADQTEVFEQSLSTPPHGGLQPASEASQRPMDDYDRAQNFIAALYHTNHGYYYDAVHRLLVLSKPLVPHPGSPPFPLAKADPEVRRLIAIMLFSTSCFEYVRHFELQPIPHMLLHPESMVVKMTYVSYGKQDGLNTKWGYNDENGTFHAEAAPMYFGHTLVPAN